jgi:uncharacterized protein YerC
VNSSLKRQLLKVFSQMLADLTKPNEAEVFLADFFDQDELDKYIKRLAVVYWIKKGRDQENITRNLGATKKEFQKAEKLLKKDGVKLALKKIEAEEWANVWAEKIRKVVK